MFALICRLGEVRGYMFLMQILQMLMLTQFAVVIRPALRNGCNKNRSVELDMSPDLLHSTALHNKYAKRFYQ